ncbi:hypothetical protein MMC27_001362 [Xylographa pallens]|nr:hypothetical protein [Xylographa pallens]
MHHKEQDQVSLEIKHHSKTALKPDASCLARTLPDHDPALLGIHSQPWSSDTLVDDHDSYSRKPQASYTHSHQRKSSGYLYPIPETGTCYCFPSSDNISSDCYNQSALHVPSPTTPCESFQEGDETKNSLTLSEESPHDHRSSGIWIREPLNARNNAHETSAHSSRPHAFKDEHRALHDGTMQIFPKCVARYISHRRMVISLIDQIRLLQIRPSLNPQPASSKLATESQQTLKERLTVLTDEMKALRTTCLQASHSLYEIDQILVIPLEETLGPPNPHPSHPHQDVLALRKSTLASHLLQSWTTRRDRINNWLLHSLRADDQLAQLHRSILGEQHLSEKAWARLVLKHWTLDEAATGGPLSRAQSAAATNSVHSASTQSLDFWTCNEDVGSGDELLTRARLGRVRSELGALKRQHHRRLYKVFVDSGSSGSDERDCGLVLEMRRNE